MTKPAVIHEGNGFSYHTNVVQAVRAIACLKAIAGNLDSPGGNVCFPSVAGAPALIDALLTQKPYQPRALMIYHSNPLLADANYNRLKEALNKLDFVVAFDIFKTRTVEEVVDLVLPDTCFLENYDYRTYPSAEGTVVALRQPVVSPRHEAKSFYEVEQELAKRMGFADKYPWHTVEEFFAYALAPSSLDLPTLKKKPICIVGKHEYRKYEKGLLRQDGKTGFNTPSGKIELYSSVYEKLGYEAMPTYHEPSESPRENKEQENPYPLTGVNRRSVNYVHFKYRNLPYLREIEPEPHVHLHSSDAKARFLTDGDLVQISSPLGHIKMKLRITERVKPGVVLIDGGWGNLWDFEAANSNVLVDDVKRDPISQSNAISSFLCEVTKIVISPTARPPSS